MKFVVGICIGLMLTGCGYNYDWVSIPNDVHVVSEGFAHDNPKAFTVWMNAEACAGHASREPIIVEVDGIFKCGHKNALGCASPERGIIVLVASGNLQGYMDYDNTWVLYHEAFHLIMHTDDEDLANHMADQCKNRFDNGG